MVSTVVVMVVVVRSVGPGRWCGRALGGRSCVSSGLDLLGLRRRRGLRDRGVVLAASDGDLAGLGLLRDGDAQGEYARVVVGPHVFGVEGVAEEQLPREHAERAFGDLHLHVVTGGGR